MVVYLSEVECLAELVDGLKRAAGCSHALAHYQSNPQWLAIRDKLEGTIEYCQRLVTAKSMPRQQVLEELIKREANVPKDINGN